MHRTPLLLTTALLLSACATGGVNTGTTAPGGSIAAVCSGIESAEKWADCALEHMTPREKAAQMVWPQLFGNYVAADDPEWERLAGFIKEEKVGGVIISVGSPLEIAAKLNALQKMSDLPLLVSSDLETGVGFRARGGYFLPNAIYLGGSTIFPPQMAIGATGDTTFAHEMGRVTAL
ncbi:MAG TPA: glycoside hydrolase family 3 N-terminal domain-containing protein, partial [Gemmatimonadaceae bacterium]|nr:glycoside hydrolase family 3 N-terminal domain-containing protein [Gemmatimonadaceae bacterium]